MEGKICPFRAALTPLNNSRLSCFHMFKLTKESIFTSTVHVTTIVQLF
jgi:hypothetical protein